MVNSYNGEDSYLRFAPMSSTILLKTFVLGEEIRANRPLNMFDKTLLSISSSFAALASIGDLAITPINLAYNAVTQLESAAYGVEIPFVNFIQSLKYTKNIWMG